MQTVEQYQTCEVEYEECLKEKQEFNKTEVPHKKAHQDQRPPMHPKNNNIHTYNQTRLNEMSQNSSFLKYAGILHLKKQR